MSSLTATDAQELLVVHFISFKFILSPQAGHLLGLLFVSAGVHKISSLEVMGPLSCQSHLTILILTGFKLIQAERM